MPAQVTDPKDYQNIFHWAETQEDGAIPSFAVRKNDPYEVSCPGNHYHYHRIADRIQYQVGFGNQ
jgi:homogentisate 1,2-dioxygenase